MDLYLRNSLFGNPYPSVYVGVFLMPLSSHIAVTKLMLFLTLSVSPLRMTGREFFTRFPALYPFLLNQLEAAAATVER